MATIGSDKQCTINDGSWLQPIVIIRFVLESPIMIGYFTHKNYNFSYEVVSRKALYQNYIVERDLKLCIYQLFNLKSLTSLNIQYKISYPI
jgi:hypothetical protein